MTRIFFSKSLVRALRFRSAGWKALSLAVLLIVSLAVWRLGVVGYEQSPYAKLLTPTAAASDSTQRPAYDLSRINGDVGYYHRVDANRLYEMAPIPAGQRRHEEIRIIGEAIRLAIPQSWLEQPLVVLAKPGRPLTFVALDSGKFPNGDISITVKADGSGLASASFFVTNEGRYRVLVSSPENAGPAVFQVYCMSKTMRDEVRSGRYAERYFAEVKANKKREAAAAAELAERIRQKRSK
jgi:hypothetical protein